MSPNIDGQAWARAQLPGRFGGLALRAPLQGYRYASYWAAADLHAATVPPLLAALGRPVRGLAPEARWIDDARQRLRERGAAVNFAANVAPTRAAMEALQVSAWAADLDLDGLAKASSQRHLGRDKETVPSITRSTHHARLLSRIMQVLEATTAAQCHAQLGRENAAAMLSAGGPGTGTTWSLLAATPFDMLPNAHWILATMDRLALPWDPGTASCQLAVAATGVQCGAALRTSRWHAHVCGEGAAKFRPHRHMAGALGRLVRDTRGFCDMEVYIPELHQRASAKNAERLAIMDAVISWPGAWDRTLVDVSTRSAHAARYRDTHNTPGVAAAQGEREKFDRYGDKVVPLVLESLGRMGSTSRLGLQRLLRTASCLGASGAGAVNKWRAALEKAVLFAVADNSLMAMGLESTARLGAVLDAAHAARPCQVRRQPAQAPPQFGAGEADTSVQTQPHADAVTQAAAAYAPTQRIDIGNVAGADMQTQPQADAADQAAAAFAATQRVEDSPFIP